MILFRMVTMAVIGLGVVAGLGWLTSAPFALYCYGILMAGVAANQAGSASPLYVPAWMSSAGGQLFLAGLAIFSFTSPVVIGVVWFRWWWGFAGYALAGIGAGLAAPLFHGIVGRFLLGLVIAAGSVVAILR